MIGFDELTQHHWCWDDNLLFGAVEATELRAIGIGIGVGLGWTAGW